MTGSIVALAVVAVAYEQAVAVTAAYIPRAVECVIHHRMPQRAGTAITGDFIGMGGDVDDLRLNGHIAFTVWLLFYRYNHEDNPVYFQAQKSYRNPMRTNSRLMPKDQIQAPIPLFTDNRVAIGNAAQYAEILVDAGKILQNWRASLMAHEYLDKTGAVKSDDDITETRLEKRETIRQALADGQTLEKPVLGIGIFDNVEIGAGADILVTLFLEGHTVIPVHVRKSQMNDFVPFRA